MNSNSDFLKVIRINNKKEFDYLQEKYLFEGYTWRIGDRISWRPDLNLLFLGTDKHLYHCSMESYERNKKTLNYPDYKGFRKEKIERLLK